MLRIWCCLQPGCILQWLNTFAANFWRPKCLPSCSNIEFFTKCWYGQANIAYQSTLTIQASSTTPILYKIVVLTPEIACAAFYTVKHMTIFDFKSKKQQHLQLLAIWNSQRNGQESTGISRLLEYILNTSGMKEYIFLVPHVGTQIFLPIYPLLLFSLFLVF